MRGYIAVGHGKTPGGTFDPGAIGSGVREYDLAFAVVAATSQSLVGKCDFDTETNGGPGHDPDYRGSAAIINEKGYDWAIEVHFDYDKAPRGGLGLWLDTDDLQWCQRISHHYLDRGLPFRGLDKRPGLYLLRSVRCPVVIWECDRVGADVTPEQLTAYGECIAAGTLDFLAWKFPNTNPGKVDVMYPRIATDPSTGLFWVLTGPEGGIDARGADGAQADGAYYGNLIDHPNYNAGLGHANGPAVDIGVWEGEHGPGYVIYCRDAQGQYHPYHFDSTTRP